MKIKKFIILLAITFALPFIPSLLIENSVNGLVLPKLYPPNFLFPVVWSIIYLLNTIGLYLVSEKNDNLYLRQLIVNSFWTIIFFGLRLRLFAFIWLLILLILVVIMIIKFYKENKLAAYLQIPYVLWLLYAGYLNFAIYLLNS